MPTLYTCLATHLRGQWLFLIGLLLFVSCNKEDDRAELQVQLETLSSNIEERDNMLNEMNTRMDSIGALLDSIEREEEGIVLNLEKGIRYNDYVSRLANIREFMNLSKVKLAEMEKMLANSSAPNKVYEKIIANYKKMLADAEQNIVQLQEKMNEMQVEKDALVKTVDLQNEEIEVLQKEVERQQEELLNLKEEVTVSKAEIVKVTADKYFSLAQSMEELGNKTSGLLNAKKKKGYYRQAYEYYKQAYDLNSSLQDAAAKISELEAKL